MGKWIMPLSRGRGAWLFPCKRNVLECGNHCTIKLLEHGMKVVKRVFEKRLRKMIELREEQYGFVAGKGTTDAIFILGQLHENYLKNENSCIWCLHTWRKHLTECREC